MKPVCLSLGSNCDGRRNHISSGLQILREMLDDARHSSIYETPDAHGGERPYMNAVITGFTEFSETDLEMFCKELELQEGRTPEARRRGDVPLDVDLVIYDGKVRKERDYHSEFFRIGFLQIMDAPL